MLLFWRNSEKVSSFCLRSGEFEQPGVPDTPVSLADSHFVTRVLTRLLTCPPSQYLPRLSNWQYHGWHCIQAAAQPWQGSRYWYQQPGHQLPEPGLRDSAAALPWERTAFLRRYVPGWDLLLGIQRAGSRLIQDPRGDLEKTHGQ